MLWHDHTVLVRGLKANRKTGDRTRRKSVGCDDGGAETVYQRKYGNIRPNIEGLVSNEVIQNR